MKKIFKLKSHREELNDIAMPNPCISENGRAITKGFYELQVKKPGELSVLEKHRKIQSSMFSLNKL